MGEVSGWDLRVRPAAASGNLGTWKSKNLEIWKLEIWDLEIQKFGDLGTCKSRNVGFKKYIKCQNISKSKSVLPKMSARSGLVGKNHRGPIWDHLGPIFPWAGKMQKICNFCLLANGPYSTALAPRLDSSKGCLAPKVQIGQKSENTTFVSENLIVGLSLIHI